MKTQILNSKGEQVVLNAREASLASALQHRYNSELKNALGFEVDITTMTAISKSVVEQKFYEFNPLEYIPIRVGDGAWATEILTWKSFNTASNFSDGVINAGSNNSRLASASAGVEPVRTPIKNWGMEISYTFMELQQAARAGNWDLVVQLERARKQAWDLGVQRTAFLGLEGSSDIKGLLTQSDVNSNTTLITKKISAMTAAEFDTLVQGLLAAYTANANYTAMPNRFVIPFSDYVGLAAPVSATYPNVSKLEYLEKAFKMITRKNDFVILPLAYADQANNATVPGLNKNRYSLFNYNEDTLRMDIPVPYTNTLQNTINGFHFQNVGYGQFSSVQAYRPQEILYFDWS